MRKRIITPERQESTAPDEDWLYLEELVEVEITSEDPDRPIESALLPGQLAGWRAADPGEQTIRILFPKPHRLRRIWLNFVETEIERTQEYVLRWSPDGGDSYREIQRQQWNFSPTGATCEMEDHHVDLPAVTVLELSIKPDISGRDAYASLRQMRLA